MIFQDINCILFSYKSISDNLVNVFPLIHNSYERNEYFFMFCLIQRQMWKILFRSMQILELRNIEQLGLQRRKYYYINCSNNFWNHNDSS